MRVVDDAGNSNVAAEMVGSCWLEMTLLAALTADKNTTQRRSHMHGFAFSSFLTNLTFVVEG